MAITAHIKENAPSPVALTQNPAFCPFCKCADGRVSVRRQGKGGYRVICGRCGASGPYIKIGDRPKLEAQAEAVTRWNSRWEISG